MTTINKISLGVILILGIVLFFIYSKNVELRYDNVRLQSNYEIVQKRSNRAQELTQQEFKEFYRRYDSIASILNIKTKNIQTVIVTDYRYKDTTVIQAQTVIDTIKHRIAFDVSEPSGCYNILGFVNSDSTVWVNGISIHDKFEVFLYSEKDKWFWSFKKFWQKPKNKAKIFSECKNDTIQVLENIKIIKK